MPLLCTLLHAGGLPAADDTRVPRHALAVIDDVITTQRFLDDIPGASVAVVHQGRVLHQGGYGVADPDSGTPVSAERTLFGTGSVAKLFTWTAVMQLVEQGQLELDRDINDYIDAFQLPATFPEPVTLAHLITHTAGFEDRNIGFYAQRPEDLIPLEAFLASHMPARIYPPGQVSAYSNYGAGLAGHIVAVVTGMPFEQYIEEHILKPLAMAHSSFRQPLPATLAANEARGIRVPGEPGGRSWYQARPSGALRATAADMARFMIAQLQQGRFGETRILAPATAAAMQRRHFGNHPDVNGLTLGFQELARGGRRVLWQRGDTLYFTAAVLLVPELELGVYVAYNRARVGHAPLELLDAILAILQPPRYPSTPPRPPADPAPTGHLTGSYRSTRNNETTVEKLLKPFTPVRVRAHAPGVLHISGLAMGGDTQWFEVTPRRYQAIDSAEYVVFRPAEAGQPVYLFEGNMPVAAYYRLPWYGNPQLHALLLAACALIFLANLSLQLWQRWGGQSGAARMSRLRPVEWSATALCSINLVFIIALFLVMHHVLHLLFGIPPLARAVLLMPWLSLPVTVLTAALLLQAWVQRAGSLSSRLRLGAVAVGGMAFVWLMVYWRLL